MSDRTAQRLSRRDFLRLSSVGVGVLGLAACVAPAAPGAAPAAADGEGAAPAPEAVTISHAVWGGVVELEVMNNTADAFHEEFPDITVEIIQFPSDYGPKVDAMMVAGEGPDAMQVSVEEYAPRGALLNLQPYIDQDAEFNIEDIYPALLNGLTYQGDLYKLPYGAGPQVMYWNVDFFEQAGLTSPNDLNASGEWNWETFHEAATQLTRTDDAGNQVWGYFVYNTRDEPMYWAYKNGAQLFNEQVTESYLDAPESVEAVQRLADMDHVDGIAADRATIAEIGTWNSFLNGRTAMFFSGPWQRGRLVDMEWAYDIAPMPAGASPIEFTVIPGANVWSQSQFPDAGYAWVGWRTKDRAAEIWSSQGVDLPPRQSQMAGDMWRDEAMNPASADVFATVMAAAEATPDLHLTQRAYDALIAGWDQIFAEGAAAADVLPTVNQEITTILQETQRWEP
jgi:multiple sugar transport system substrate-binding protein